MASVCPSKLAPTKGDAPTLSRAFKLAPPSMSTFQTRTIKSKAEQEAIACIDSGVPLADLPWRQSSARKMQPSAEVFVRLCPLNQQMPLLAIDSTKPTSS